MARAEFRSLRFSRFEKEWLLAALLISLFLHLTGWGVYEGGKKLKLWSTHKPGETQLAAQRKSPEQASNEDPLIFIDVSHAEPEPPKKTVYYSNKNARAANPEVQHDANQPKLDGKQQDIPKTEDVPKVTKLQPTLSAPQLNPATEQPTEPVQERGDLDALKKPTTPPTQQRPRTLKQAQAQPNQQRPGQQMKLNGGVKRQRVYSSLDVRATTFGDYDSKIVDAVTDRWYALLDSNRFAQDRTGKVVVHFKLKYDGTILEMTTAENTVGQMLGYVCHEAIQEAAPFAKWPDDMRRMIGANFREISFSFYYY